MNEWVEMFVISGALAGQFLFGTLAILALLKLVPKRRIRWKHMTFLKWQTKSVSDQWLSRFRISRQKPYFQERELLLAGCGVTADAAWYIIARRLAIAICLAIAAFMLIMYRSLLMNIAVQAVVGTALLVPMLLMLDRKWLRSIRKLRTLQITKEIFVISNQLLYLSDSNLHIHSKLMRCVPYARAMRNDLERLLADWYHDPGMALQRFKQRLGTDEGMSFVETIDALRQHESGHYYELLRARIEDYKEKLDLAKESRKESASYVLFVIAGIPILYTFQVFIFPWVKEGQKLFQSLN